MSAGADRGHLAVQRRFPIAPDETAFSLNAKCFDAGIASFNTLIEHIEAGEVPLTPQDPTQRSYFAKYQRPSSASVIDFAQRADQVARFVAAHQLGPGYPNPFASAKLAGPQAAITVGHVQVSDTPSTAPPGTLIAFDERADGLAIQVATQTTDVYLSELSCLAGTPLTPKLAIQLGLEPGIAAATLREDVQTQLDDALRAETLVLEQLTEAPPLESSIEAPSTSDAEHGGRDASTVTLDGGALTDKALAACALALSASLASGPRTLALRAPTLDQASKDTHGVLAARGLCTVSLDPHAPRPAALDALAHALQDAAQGATYARDFLIREPKLHALGRDAHGAVLPLELRLGAGLDQPLAPGCALAIEVRGARCTLRFDPTHISAQAVETLAGRFEQLIAQAKEQDRTLSYAALDARSSQLARHLRTCGVEPQQRVGLSMQRSIDMVVGALAILKTGAAHIPLDPEYPAERIALMIEDAALQVIVAHRQTRLALSSRTARIAASDATGADAAQGGVNTHRVVCIDHDADAIASQRATPLVSGANSDDLAYVIYTSGSTGRPKGVMVEHRNVVNFLVGMDQRLGHDEQAPPTGAWLALTSMNFDISVLELFWPLTRGLHVVVHADEGAQETFENARRSIDFGLFYFSSDESEGLADKYQLLLEGARFADAHGFNAVWTPERHFHAFGGLFPNPSVTSAALATITKNVHLRAGSCVTPLHSPIRVAEEWSVVDNLSGGGRVGISVAAGWQPNDFVIRPERWEGRREKMFEEIALLRALWRGESATFPNGQGEPVDIRILPRPVSDELPIWVTAAGNPETFREAGAAGANLLTHLLGQSLDELAEKIAIYRQARADAGIEGRGVVSLMLHTFIGTSNHESRETVREPMKNYLRSAVGLVKAAAWSFPTFKKTTTMDDGSFGIDHLADDEMDALLNHAFERYYDNAGLFGDIPTALRFVDQIKGIDVDEIPCLIDFGVPSHQVLEALPRLAEVLRRANEHALSDAQRAAQSAEGDSAAPDQSYDIAAQCERHGVTHLQCTPSQMALLTVQEPVRQALSRMDHVLVGGETLPAPLARDLATWSKAPCTTCTAPPRRPSGPPRRRSAPTRPSRSAPPSRTPTSSSSTRSAASCRPA